MNISRFILLSFLVTSLGVSVFCTELFAMQDALMNDTIMNMTNTNIVVQVQFSKGYNSERAQKSDVKNYAVRGETFRTVSYIVEPKKMIRVFDTFFKANPGGDTSFWVPVRMTFKVMPESNRKRGGALSISIESIRNSLGDEFVKSKKYIVNMLNDNELQVEVENTLKSS